MPATPEDIAAGRREATIVERADAAIAARYPSARDGKAEPAEGYCDLAADAQAVLDARAALIGVERRRFAVRVDEVVWPDLTGGVPTATLVDAEHDVAGDFLVARIEIDLEAETTAYELFG